MTVLARSSDYIRRILKRCCRGHCQTSPGHLCDRPPVLRLEEIYEPGGLEARGPLDPDVQTRIQGISGRPVTPNNRIRLLLNGTDTYDAMFDLIRSAENEICFENFIFRADAVGLAFAAEMRRRAKEDRISVRILHDPAGSPLSVLPIAWRFRGSSARVRLYNPLPTGPRFLALGRDHRKLVVQDRRRVVTGGLCIADVWLGNCISHCTWRDSAILAEGDAAIVAAQAFDQISSHGISLTWRRHGLHTPPGSIAVESLGEVPVRVVADFRHHRATEQTLIEVSNAARHEILITNQYFIPTPPLVCSLIDAVKRGVDVQLILPRMGRPLIAGLATDYHLGRLLAAGVKVWRWKGPMMHAKTVVVDRMWSLVGSSNIDPLSFRFNAELNLEVHGAGIGNQMAAIFANDLLTCTPYTYNEWRSRSAMRRGLAQFARLAGPIL